MALTRYDKGITHASFTGYRVVVRMNHARKDWPKDEQMWIPDSKYGGDSVRAHLAAIAVENAWKVTANWNRERNRLNNHDFKNFCRVASGFNYRVEFKETILKNGGSKMCISIVGSITPYRAQTGNIVKRVTSITATHRELSQLYIKGFEMFRPTDVLGIVLSTKPRVSKLNAMLDKAIASLPPGTNVRVYRPKR